MDPTATPMPPNSTRPDASPTLNAFAAIRKSGMSITLPRNFAPLSLDPNDAPRTPDQTFAELELPPPPPHSTFRARRPRLNLDSFRSSRNPLSTTLFASELTVPSSAGPWLTEFSRQNGLSSDEVVPSIEPMSAPLRPQLFQAYSEPADAFRLRLAGDIDAPQTPSCQITKGPLESKNEDWTLKRTTSLSSQRSDSSLSTAETSETRPTSYDGSVGAQDGELGDPFSPQEHIKVIPATPQRRSKKQRITSFLSKNDVDWTIDMDNHLFNVYQIYLADPTVTPFKTVPGSIPPTGVCHRVARKAKETWPRASRVDFPIIKRYKVRSMLDVRQTPRAMTPDPENFLTDRRATWPSEGATRKRLKKLCREKFTITAHYNRMRQSRSPSPFADQFLPKRPSRLSVSPMINSDADNTSYSTREMHINLVATGATEPLAQLTTGDSPKSESALESFNREVDSVVMNTSPPTGLGIQEQMPVVDKGKLYPGVNIPRLASPFNYNTWNGPVRPENHHRRQVSQNHFDTMHATGPRLLSPFQPDTEGGMNLNKRRAQHNLEDELSPSGSSLAGHTSGLILDEQPPAFVEAEANKDIIFSGLGDIGQRRVRLRNRGATLGTAHERIARLFSPPPSADTNIPAVPALPAQPTDLMESKLHDTNLAIPQADPNHRRLGSPFELDPNKRSIRNKPRHLPSLSDPFIQFTHGIPSASITTQQNANIGNIGERLASFQQNLPDYRLP